MKCYKIFLSSILITSVFGCTKLNEKLNDSFEKTGSGSGAVNVTALLNKAYSDFSVFTAQDQVFSLEENTADQTLVPTRGGDWDDNGVWRVLHAHKWDATHGQTSSVFTALGTMESDATTVLANGPSAEEAAEAYFIRTVSQFYLLDLYGQVPFRTIATYNAIGPSQVLSPQEAIDTMVATLTRIIPVLPAGNSPYRASPDAANFLLMKILLNKGAFLNRAAPTFDAADMAQVITLGTQMMGGKYSLTADYFDNFGPNNATTSKEMILAYPNNGTPSNNGISAIGINARWMMTLHYNSWDQQAPNAGWNGFSTVADFYNSFEPGDKRLTETYPGVTDVSGLRVGLLAGQQVDQNGDNIKDRKGNNLIFTPDVSLVEADPNTLEDRGIRVIKYPPDYSAYSSGNQHNQQVFFRYADVVLMVAEAQLRTNDAGSATTTINILRSARNASAIGTLDLPTLLAERGREMYWESWRRQDLIRFGKYLDPWALKTDDDPKYLLFPIPPTQLVANPNLKQNPGY